jgi:hypothetical protein
MVQILKSFSLKIVQRSKYSNLKIVQILYFENVHNFKFENVHNFKKFHGSKMTRFEKCSNKIFKFQNCMNLKIVQIRKCFIKRKRKR